MIRLYKLAVIALAVTMFTETQAQNCDCMVPLDETFSVVPFTYSEAPEYRNDDRYSSAISLPFSFELYGTLHNEIYIANNGHLSFDSTLILNDALGFSGCD
jgi:hypothetical protein